MKRRYLHRQTNRDKHRKREHCSDDNSRILKASYTTPKGQFLSTYKPLLTPSPTVRHDPGCPLVAASNQYLNASLWQI